MAWGEFKEAVEKEGVEDDDQIWFIDVSFPMPDDFEQGRIGVSRDRDCGIAIC